MEALNETLEGEDYGDCPVCGLPAIKLWTKKIGCAIHGTQDVKGDRPGHPFHGNQWTTAGSNEISSFHHNAAVNHLNKAREHFNKGHYAEAAHSLVMAHNHMGNAHSGVTEHLRNAEARMASHAPGGDAGREHLLAAHRLLAGHLKLDHPDVQVAPTRRVG